MNPPPDYRETLAWCTCPEDGRRGVEWAVEASDAADRLLDHREAAEWHVLAVYLDGVADGWDRVLDLTERPG